MRAYYGPRLGRRSPAMQSSLLTPDKLGASLKLWLRADLGFDSGAKTWVNQADGRVFTSSGAPSVVAEPTLNGQAAVQFAAGGADAFYLGAGADIASTFTWCWLVVARTLSGAGACSFFASVVDDKGGALIDPSTGQLYSRSSLGEYVGTSAPTPAPGTNPFVAMMGRTANTARFNGESLTHAGLNAGQVLTGAASNTALAYTINGLQIAEIILASASTLTSLAPYVEERYWLTL